jgi:hypothetical protein
MSMMNGLRAFLDSLLTKGRTCRRSIFEDFNILDLSLTAKRSAIVKVKVDKLDSKGLHCT